MTVVLHPKFPAPIRATQTVRLSKVDDEPIDLGWCEGVLSDGRPFRAEMWVQDQITMVTFFFSTIDLENAEHDKLTELILAEELVTPNEKGRGRRNDYHQVEDDAGQSMWSINVAVGAEDETYLAKMVPMFRYQSDGEPLTLFRRRTDL